MAPSRVLNITVAKPTSSGVCNPMARGAALWEWRTVYTEPYADVTKSPPRVIALPPLLDTMV